MVRPTIRTIQEKIINKIRSYDNRMTSRRELPQKVNDDIKS